MNKYFSVIAAVILPFVCHAERCTYCPCTAPLRLVDGRYYCNKHYCFKHKAIHREGPCEECDIASRIARGKFSCSLCSTKRNITVVKDKDVGLIAFCAEHYCTRHRMGFSRSYTSGLSCSKCNSEAQLNKLNEMKAEPLSGMFGVTLGAPLASLVTTPSRGEKDVHLFTPEKKFRDFKCYCVIVADKRIIAIRTVRYFDYESAAQDEFETLLAILDRKYGRTRRGKILERGLYDRRVDYDFGCDVKSMGAPRQRITLGKIRDSGDGYRYEVSIMAYLVSELEKMIETDARKDLDALE